MINNSDGISLRMAALIAGLAILTMAIAAPFAELFVGPKLVVTVEASVLSDVVVVQGNSEMVNNGTIDA